MTSSHDVFGMFEKIAAEPIKAVNFPSHFEIALKLKSVIAAPSSTVRKVVDIVHGEPLIASKIITAANTVTVRGSEPVSDLEKAVIRLGIDHVRRIALVTAVNQLRVSKHTLQYASLARRVWLRSLYVAAASSVIAKERTEFSPGEAQFAGLLLNLGGFYLLHRIGSVPNLIIHPDDVKEGLSRHYLPTTRKILEHLGIPKTIQQAMEIEGYQKNALRYPPKTLAEVLNVSNTFANDRISWYEEDANSVEIPDEYLDLKDKIHDQFLRIQSEYR